MRNARTLARLAEAGVVAGLLAWSACVTQADGAPVTGTTVSPYVVDWSGAYIGGKLGGAWSDVSWSQNANYFTTLGPAVVGTDSSFAPSGFAGGIIVGTNWQHGRWVVGAELSFSRTDFSESRASPFFPAIDTFTTDLDWLATAEGRIGYAWDRLLLFGKGGWAGGNARLKLTDRTAGVIASGDTFGNGWAIGGGIEYAHWANIILGIEYSFTSLSIDKALSCPGCGTDASIGEGAPSIGGDIEVNAVMARASYLFKH